MTKRHLPIDYDFYDLYRTEEFKQSIIESFVQLQETQPEGFAERWLEKIEGFVDGLATPVSLGEINPKDFSDTYAHIQVRGTKTTIFLLVEHDQIYLVTSGYSGRNWPRVLKNKQPEIERQIAILKTRHGKSRASTPPRHKRNR